MLWARGWSYHPRGECVERLPRTASGQDAMWALQDQEGQPPGRMAPRLGPRPDGRNAELVTAESRLGDA